MAGKKLGNNYFYQVGYVFMLERNNLKKKWREELVKEVKKYNIVVEIQFLHLIKTNY